MRQRILSIILVLAGVLAIGLAVASATVWKPSNTDTATLAKAPTTNYLVTEPGVLGLLDENVTITATAQNQDEQVLIAVGRSTDVSAWLGDDPYEAITGLSSWDTLAVAAHTQACTAATSSTSTSTATGAATASTPTAKSSATATALATASTTSSATVQPTVPAENCVKLKATKANPTGSDLWISQTTGTGSATLEFDASDPNLVILVATNGASAAPTLSLSWPRSVSTPWLVPGLVIGALLLFSGVFFLIIDIMSRRATARRRALAAQKAARRAQADVTSTSVMTAIDATPADRPLTRREKREKERAEEAGEEWIDPRIPTEIIPETRQAGAEGLARGSAVLPGLSPAATRAHRQGRELTDDTPMVFAHPAASETEPEPEPDAVADNASQAQTDEENSEDQP